MTSTTADTTATGEWRKLYARSLSHERASRRAGTRVVVMLA